MKEKMKKKPKVAIMKHLKEDIHEEKEMIKDDKKLMKKMKSKKGC